MLKAAEMRKKQSKSGVKDWIFVVMGLNTGLRISEIAALKCKHVVLKGAMYPHIFVEEGKTASSRRRIPLNSKTVKDILEYLEYKVEWDEELLDDEPFLRSPMGGKYTRNGLFMAFKRVVKLAKNIENPRRFHPHSMRHTFGTHLYESSGHDPKVVQELLGHSRIDVTLKVYVSLFDKERIKAVENLY
jgi:integrase